MRPGGGWPVFWVVVSGGREGQNLRPWGRRRRAFLGIGKPFRSGETRFFAERSGALQGDADALPARLPIRRTGPGREH